MGEQMSSAKEFSDKLRSNYAFMGKTVFDLHCLIQKQSDELYLEKEMGFPVVVSSTLLFLDSVESASTMEIGRVLNHTHQLVAQRIKILLKHNLIAGMPDPNDKRKTLYHLTAAGQQKAQILQLYCDDARIAFQSLSDELGVDIQQLLNDISSALKKKSFAERFPPRNKTYSELVNDGSQNHEN